MNDYYDYSYDCYCKERKKDTVAAAVGDDSCYYCYCCSDGFVCCCSSKLRSVNEMMILFVAASVVAVEKADTGWDYCTNYCYCYCCYIDSENGENSFSTPVTTN